MRNQKLKVVDPKRTLPEDFTIAVDRLPLVTGNIHFIRGVDSRGKISVLNDYFDVGKGYTGELKSVENLVIVCISVACGKVELPQPFMNIIAVGVVFIDLFAKTKSIMPFVYVKVNP
ncbi:hypothetical protein C5S29_14440 [ANME-1 cluster archaeon GoMg3.2]|nr:hypothetical protein [ANME-1 cluster archaeon GoMg3.2]